MYLACTVIFLFFFYSLECNDSYSFHTCGVSVVVIVTLLTPPAIVQKSSCQFKSVSVQWSKQSKDHGELLGFASCKSC